MINHNSEVGVLMKKTVNSLQSDRYEFLVSSIHDYAIYMLDTEGIISSWNAGAYRFKGYEAEEIIGRHFSCFYTVEDQEAGLPEKALRFATLNGAYEAQGWRVRKDGTKFWANVVIDPLKNEAGELVGFAKITRDITERKVADEALRASEQRFSMLVQAVTDYAIYMLSPEGIVTNWNAGAMRIKGYSENDVIGTHYSRFHSEEDQALELPHKALIMAAQEGRYENEGWRIRKDGSKFWAHVIIDVIRDDLGTLVGFAKVTQDITEKKQASIELEAANAALAQSQKIEALGNLTGGVAHDFNNLLSVISSGLDILAMQDKYDHEKMLIDSMQRAVTRGATLTQQLLSFARRQPLIAKVQNINSLISNFELLLKQAGNSKMECFISLDPDLYNVKMDAAGFETSLLNLLVNAGDAMPNGGHVYVKTQNKVLKANEIKLLEAGNYIMLTVKDTGSGMTQEVLDKVFEPFFTTKQVGKGTGLGLSQVYGFIQQSGGEIIIESQINKGTSVNIYLPAVSEILEIESDFTAFSFKESKVKSANNTVLIVEDEPDLLSTASELFKLLGYEVLTATNGVEAINLIEKESVNVDILFSDVVMPNGVSGIALGRSVRKHLPNIKIILCSGYPLPALKEEHGSLDGFAFLNKPYKLANLVQTLMEKD